MTPINNDTDPFECLRHRYDDLIEEILERHRDDYEQLKREADKKNDQAKPKKITGWIRYPTRDLNLKPKL